MISESESESLCDPVLEFNRRLTLSSTKSIFGISDDFDNSKWNKSLETIEYERQLDVEIKEWFELFKSSRIKSFEDKVVDLSILTHEQLAYLKQAPDLHDFIADSLRFVKRTNKYIKGYYKEVVELYDNLMELSDNSLITKKSRMIEETIFN